MTIVLCWDIDGTLLSTGRAGIYALEAAVAEFVGRPVDLQAVETAGLTDPQIVAAILRSTGIDPTLSAVETVLRGYEDRLPASLHRKRGGVMPNVEAVLDATVGRADVMTLLLTGNTRRGAAAKLAHYGLARYFGDGAFSDGIPDRVGIAARARAMARERLGDIAPEQLIVIGDTPHDIHCAAAIGARCLAVATGAHDPGLLAALEPWRVVNQLPDPAGFLRLVDLEHPAAMTVRR